MPSTEDAGGLVKRYRYVRTLLTAVEWQAVTMGATLT